MAGVWNKLENNTRYKQNTAKCLSFIEFFYCSVYTKKNT